MAMKVVIADLKKTEKITKELAKKVLKQKSASRRKKAAVIGLEGELGSGKTTFAQFFAKALGIKRKIQSPTFVIIKKYKIKNKTFIHIDAYRIKKPKEILELEWKELITNPKNIVLIEWADKIKKILPKNYFKIKLEILDEKTRKIKIR